MKDKLHIIKIFAIITALIVIGFIVDMLLQPKSFNEYGHYRWDAVNEINSRKVVYQNIKTCGSCHKDIEQLHGKDAHYNVPCVDCHGAGDLHVAYHRHDSSAKNISSVQAMMPKEFTLEGCLFCHRKLKARPTDFPQIDPVEHYKFLNVIDPQTKCIACHSPHEPVFLLTEVSQSRLHPIVYKCTDCHNKKPDKDFHEIADHPKIFECKDCHAEIVNDFNTKPHHNYVECRTCHLFHKEDENIGRMYKNGNLKFCLLCHEKKPFKSPTYPPKIDWPSHIGKLGFLLNINQKLCLDCHSNQIHKMDLKTNPNPHANNWINDHPKFAKDINKSNFGQSACGTCHKQDFCFSCHKVEIPHPKGWDENHKDIVAKKGKAICMNCHKEDFCGQCH